MRSPLLRREFRDFRTFWIGQSVSLIGDDITLFAVPIAAVLLLHAHPGDMGLLTAAGLLPSLLLSLPAGAWVDRWGRRRLIMLVCDIIRAVLLLSIPLAYALGELSLVQLYLVAFVIGVFDVFFSVSYQSLFVSLVPEEHYVSGQALLNGSRAGAMVAGNSLAGLLVALITAPGALVVDAGTFVVSAVTLGRIKPAEAPRAAKESGALAVGIRFIMSSSIVRPSLAATTTVNLFTFMINAIFILYATRTLHVPPGELGVILGVAALGSIVGSLVSGRIARAIGTGPMFAVGCVVFPVPLLLFPLAGGPHAAVLGFLLAGEFLSGFGVMMLDIGIGALFASTIPHELRARVSGAFRMINYGIRPVGALLGGALGGWLGLRPALWIAAVGASLCGLWLLGTPVLSREPAAPAPVAS
jgi:MFS family permease